MMCALLALVSVIPALFGQSLCHFNLDLDHTILPVISLKFRAHQLRLTMLLYYTGPAGLATLSAVQEDYSIDTYSDNQINRASKFIRNANTKGRAKRVCVIDGGAEWLGQWEKNFQALDIKFLRSPAVAHCSYFDRNALLAYAFSHGREDELLDSGCSDIKSLKGTSMPYNGLWYLPSTKLFLDFSREYAKSLRHDYVQGRAIDIKNTGGDHNLFNVIIQQGVNRISISSQTVILGAGATGHCIVPECLQDVNSPHIFQWQQLNQVLDHVNVRHCSQSEDRREKRILVVGGGLTAVQTAHKLIRSNRSHKQGSSPLKVVLCSRKRLVERHFDIPVKWFDFREATYHQSQFYHEPAEQRLKALKATRGGGTVPPIYMEMTREMESRGELVRIIGDVKMTESDDDKSLKVIISKSEGHGKGEEETFDAIVLACGLKPDCTVSPIMRSMQQRWPVDIVGGLPDIGEDLRWTKKLYILGGVAALSVGPDAGNLMGIARAAQTISNDLESNQWIFREETNNTRYPFEAFLDDSDSECSSDEESLF